jgi:hypothetical protein
MFGELLLNPLVTICVMCVLLMILANPLGFISLNSGLRCSRNFMSSKPLLKHSLIAKLLPCKLIGAVNMKSSIPIFSKIDITHLVSCPHAHQQNRVAERKHRHIVEVGLSLLA